MAHSDCGWTCGCAGKTVKSLENTCSRGISQSYQQWYNNYWAIHHKNLHYDAFRIYEAILDGSLLGVAMYSKACACLAAYMNILRRKLSAMSVIFICCGQTVG